MKRCFQLAEKGLGNVSPNPMVGAVIVYRGKIIGEGYHKKNGEAHAEPNAISSVKNKSLLSKSTLYVSLEPCSHFGKTPPCADLILDKKFKRVVIGNTDPNPKVNGTGVNKLKEAGIDISISVLEQKGLHLNRRFFTTQKKKRPYIVLKWAQTKNGYIDSTYKEPLQISNAKNKQLVHKWRAEEDGILVGAQTFVKDNPKLDTRNILGQSPTPIILATKNEKLDYKNWQDKSRFIVIAPTQPGNLPLNATWILLESSISDSISRLIDFNINSILIEGGSKTHQLFLDENLWDELRITTGKQNIDSGTKAASFDVKTPSFELNQEDNKVQYFINKNQHNG